MGVYAMQGPRITGLAKINKISIPVKDIASQLWCERQMEYYHTKRQYTTPAMQFGSAMHATREREVYVSKLPEPITYHDRLYKWAYDNYAGLKALPTAGCARELRIYGSINGFKVAGSVDELQLSNGKITIVEDKTIRPNLENTSPRIEADKMQLALYKRLVDDLQSGRYTYENFAKPFGIEGKTLSPDFLSAVKAIGIRDEMQSLEAIYAKMFEAMRALPEISNTIQLRYLHRDTGQLLNEISIPYDAAALNAYLVDAMKYWNGDREAQPVAEKDKWRCNICAFFGKECRTWWVAPTESISQ